jgi:ABC-type proline/glycine betaine transport system substrate-binding protein
MWVRTTWLITNEDIASGLYQELGLNFGDNMQGLYVPRYVIEGDTERGIEAMAPDLKAVADLAKYPERIQGRRGSQPKAVSTAPSPAGMSTSS